jgi:hypothetical protein
MYRYSVNRDKELIILPNNTIITSPWDSGVISNYDAGQMLFVEWDLQRADVIGPAFDEGYILAFRESDDPLIPLLPEEIDTSLYLFGNMGTKQITIRERIMCAALTKKYFGLAIVAYGSNPYMECGLRLSRGLR